MKVIVYGFFLLLLFFQPAFANETDGIGYIHTLKGSVLIRQGTVTIPAATIATTFADTLAAEPRKRRVEANVRQQN
jgi:hypothetical protein